MRTLVVDDDFVTLTKVNAILATYGKCDSATYGGQARQMYMDSLQKGFAYDLILIDINLPDMQGFDLVNFIRTHELKKNLVMSKKIIITSKSSNENVRRSLQTHCDSFLVKPIRMNTLLEKLMVLELIKGRIRPDHSIVEKSQELEILESGDKEREMIALKQEIKATKKEMFKHCLKDAAMMHLLDAVCEEEARRRINAASE